METEKNAKPKKSNAWREHVKKVREDNSSLTYKEALTEGAKTYTPKRGITKPIKIAKPTKPKKKKRESPPEEEEENTE